MGIITPTKIDRNLELTALRKQGWTYMNLAKKYNISYTRAYDIYQANKHKIKNVVYNLQKRT